MRTDTGKRKFAIRTAYEQCGVSDFYRQAGADYRNPHEPAIRAGILEAARRWELDLATVLDLACGSGEATLALRELGARNIAAIDPYTGLAYRARTGVEAEPLSFEAIASGGLGGRRYSLVVCSFALHLAKKSQLPAVAYALSQASPALLLLTPHKRPQLNREWGWSLAGEFVHERVRTRYYMRAWDDADSRLDV